MDIMEAPLTMEEQSLTNPPPPPKDEWEELKEKMSSQRKY